MTLLRGMSLYCLQFTGGVCPEPQKCRARLSQILERCSDESVRSRVEAALKKLEFLSSGIAVADNLRAEELLTCEFWGRLIASIGAVDWEDEASVCHAIRVHIRSIGTLKGPPAEIKHATVLGRVVARQQLADLFYLGQHFGSPEDALDHIAKMENRTLERIHRAWGDFDLGRFVMWSTFDETGGLPFERLPQSADHLRAKLGLDPDERGRPLLLLQYTLPSPEAAYLPTIAEAYAGDTWHRYFKPVEPAQIPLGYGMTSPWPEFGGTGLPEVVHAPVKGRHLHAVLEEIR